MSDQKYGPCPSGLVTNNEEQIKKAIESVKQYWKDAIKKIDTLEQYSPDNIKKFLDDLAKEGQISPDFKIEIDKDDKSLVHITVSPMLKYLTITFTLDAVEKDNK